MTPNTKPKFSMSLAPIKIDPSFYVKLQNIFSNITLNIWGF
jgi:hypothetical protein